MRDMLVLASAKALANKDKSNPRGIRGMVIGVCVTPVRTRLLKQSQMTRMIVAGMTLKPRA